LKLAVFHLDFERVRSGIEIRYVTFDIEKRELRTPSSHHQLERFVGRTLFDGEISEGALKIAGKSIRLSGTSAMAPASRPRNVY
jgi:hypothetical protein